MCNILTKDGISLSLERERERERERESTSKDELLHTDTPVLADQQKLIFISFVQYQLWWPVLPWAHFLLL